MKDDATTSERTKHSKSGNGGMPSLGWWSEGASQALEGLARSNSSLVQGTLDIAQEVLAFSQTRLRANLDAWSTLAACRSPEDLIKFQQSFAQNATSDCLNEAGKLTTQMVEVLRGAATCFEGQAAK